MPDRQQLPRQGEREHADRRRDHSDREAPALRFRRGRPVGRSRAAVRRPRVGPEGGRRRRAPLDRTEQRVNHPPGRGQPTANVSGVDGDSGGGAGEEHGEGRRGWPGRAQHEPATFGLGERSCEREPDARPSGVGDAPVEDARRIPRDARTLVGDGDDRARPRGTGAHADRPPAVVDRVVDEDVEDLAERAVRRADLRQIVGDHHVEVPAELGAATLPLGREVREHAGQIGVRLAGGHLTCERDQVVDRPVQPVHLVERGVDHVAPVRVRVQLRGLERHAQARQRRPELVRRIGAERPLALEHPVQTLGGHSQRVRHGVDLGHAALLLAHREVAVAQRARGLGQPPDRSGEPA